MQFSMIFEGQLAYPTRANEQHVMRDIVDQAVLAEAMGFDRVWAVEHHCLEQFAHISAPEILLSYIAAKTSRIRIGHGRAAGDDGHRLRGSRRLRRLFEWHGDLLDVPPRPVIPKPVQQPHPPPDLSSYDDGDGSDEVLRRRGEAVVAYLHQEKIEAGTELTGMFNPNHAYGAVDEAIAYVERLVDAGADEVMFLMQMGTVPQDAILESITNLGREVLPRFR